MASRHKNRDNPLRNILIWYLCHVPLGSWPEFCVQEYAGRKRLLKSRRKHELLSQFWRSHWWYMRYAFHFLTAPARRKPTFFLAGFPKCGTTYLADRLRASSDFDGPTSLAPISKETLHYRRDQPIHAAMPIRGFYPILSRASHLFDASVSYSLDPGAMQWIREEHPDARVVLVVRDQFSAFESGVNYYNLGMWREDPQRMGLYSDPSSYAEFPMQIVYRAIDYSCKNRCSIVATLKQPHMQVLMADKAPIARRFAPLVYDRWVDFHLQVFGRENVLVLDFHALCIQPCATVKKVSGFLGATDSATPQPGEHKQRFSRNASKKLFRLSPGARREIRRIFHPHNERLRAATGVDLNQHLEVQ